MIAIDASVSVWIQKTIYVARPRRAEYRAQKRPLMSNPQVRIESSSDSARLFLLTLRRFDKFTINKRVHNYSAKYFAVESIKTGPNEC
jgi:hypothetical protein